MCGGAGRKQIEMGRIECKERRWKKSGSKSVDGEEVAVVVGVYECVSVEGGAGKWFNYKPNTISLLLTRDFMVRPMFGRNS